MTRLNPPIFSLVAVISTLLPVIVGVMRYQVLDTLVRPMFWLLSISAASTIAQLVLSLLNTSNLWTLHVYLLFELPLSLYAYSRWLKDIAPRTVLRATAVGYLIFWVIAKTIFESYEGPASYSAPVSRIVLVVASIYVLYHLSSEVDTSLLADSRFWFIASSIVFGAGSAMFAAMQGLLVQQTPEVILRVYNLYWAFIVFINAGYTKALLCKPIPQTSGGH
jgi:hypothetical protein